MWLDVNKFTNGLNIHISNMFVLSENVKELKKECVNAELFYLSFINSLENSLEIFKRISIDDKSFKLDDFDINEELLNLQVNVTSLYKADKNNSDCYSELAAIGISLETIFYNI